LSNAHGKEVRKWWLRVWENDDFDLWNSSKKTHFKRKLDVQQHQFWAWKLGKCANILVLVIHKSSLLLLIGCILSLDKAILCSHWILHVCIECNWLPWALNFYFYY
jgi:hypothetical protein